MFDKYTTQCIKRPGVDKYTTRVYEGLMFDKYTTQYIKRPDV